MFHMQIRRSYILGLFEWLYIWIASPSGIGVFRRGGDAQQKE